MPLFFSSLLAKRRENKMNSDISPHIEENEAYIRKRLENCDDFIIRPMILGEEKKIRCLVVYIEVAVSNICLLYTSHDSI